MPCAFQSSTSAFHSHADGSFTWHLLREAFPSRACCQPIVCQRAAPAAYPCRSRGVGRGELARVGDDHLLGGRAAGRAHLLHLVHDVQALHHCRARTCHTNACRTWAAQCLRSRGTLPCCRSCAAAERGSPRQALAGKHSHSEPTLIRGTQDPGSAGALVAAGLQLPRVAGQAGRE